MSKQKVRRCRDVRFELDGKTVAELIEYLPKLGLPEGARITFDTVDDFGTYVPEVSFDWFEQETDEEYKWRKEQESVRNNYERQQYERLKAKFEGVNK